MHMVLTFTTGILLSTYVLKINITVNTWGEGDSVFLFTSTDTKIYILTLIFMVIEKWTKHLSNYYVFFIYYLLGKYIVITFIS